MILMSSKSERLLVVLKREFAEDFLKTFKSFVEYVDDTNTLFVDLERFARNGHEYMVYDISFNKNEYSFKFDDLVVVYGDVLAKGDFLIINNPDDYATFKRAFAKWIVERIDKIIDKWQKVKSDVVKGGGL
jgi:hypothetical protein